MLYGFGFGLHNISCQTLYATEGFDQRYLLWGIKTFNKYLERLIKDQPEYILGMGVWWQKGDKIRIETKCHNRFKNKFIDGDQEIEYQINPWVKEGDKSVFTDKIGKSYCNYISFKIVGLINKGELRSKFSFLHIPKNMPIEITKTEVERMIRTI